ncbi:hypothetical protein OG422_24180 [Streptomyces sp. NBC_01525]|uniref:hypothetical protein n=1 Tax=Streptomyces sp. NBC_01525 TaxID=2903893 RepID=UPI00386FAA0E
MAEWTRVSTTAELAEALRQAVPAIEVNGVLRGMSMITLAPGVQLRGGTLEFGAKGVRLTSDTVLEDVTIRCPEHEAAILNDHWREITAHGLRRGGAQAIADAGGDPTQQGRSKPGSAVVKKEYLDRSQIRAENPWLKVQAKRRKQTAD